MTSVKLINHSSSTADWNKYLKFTFTSLKIGHRSKNIIRIASSDSNHTTCNYSPFKIFPHLDFSPEIAIFIFLLQSK